MSDKLWFVWCIVATAFWCYCALCVDHGRSQQIDVIAAVLFSFSGGMSLEKSLTKE